MLNLNLVPEELKNKIKLKKIAKSIDNAILSLTIFFIAYLAVFYGASLYLNNYYINTKSVAISADKDTATYTKKFQEINKISDFIASKQTDFNKWSNLIYSLAQDMDTNLKLSSLKINKKNNALSIAGHAQTRESLLNFKKNIEKNKYLSNIVFPIKTLFEKKDIDFNINATIDSYDFNEL